MPFEDNPSDNSLRDSSAQVAVLPDELTDDGEALKKYLLTNGPGQGLTLVHFSAQPEPYMTRSTPFKPPTLPNTPRDLLNTRKITLNKPSMHPLSHRKHLR